MAEMENVTCYLFKDQAEEAAKFYTSIFPGAKMGPVTLHPEGPQKSAGEVLTAEFSMLGREFVAVNCGADIPYNESTSIQILVDNQDELDMYWDRLMADGGEAIECGWLKDKYGLRWQVTASALRKMLSDTDRDKANRAFQAMLSMKKMNLATLEKAYNG